MQTLDLRIPDQRSYRVTCSYSPKVSTRVVSTRARPNKVSIVISFFEWILRLSEFRVRRTLAFPSIFRNKDYQKCPPLKSKRRKVLHLPETRQTFETNVEVVEELHEYVPFQWKSKLRFGSTPRQPHTEFVAERVLRHILSYHFAEKRRYSKQLRGTSECVVKDKTCSTRFA